MEVLCSKLLNRMPKNRALGIAGSYSWSRGALDALREFAKNIKLKVVRPEVEAFASPTAEDLEQCVELGKNLGRQAGGPCSLPS